MSEFQRLNAGRLWSIMSWQQLTAFWLGIDRSAGWFIYAVGEEVPTAPSPAARVQRFIERIDQLLREDHHHDYCSIVYVDDLQTPSFIKIYDPNNLGVSCGFSTDPPPPGWIMSRVAPEELQVRRPPAENRRRWWRQLDQD